MGHNRARDNRKKKEKRAKRHACQAVRNLVQRLRVAACGVPWPREHFLMFYPVWKMTPKQVQYGLKVKNEPYTPFGTDEAS